MFLFGGCQTVEHKTESQFDQDLRGLYSKIQSFGVQTRAGGEFTPLTEAEIEELIAEITLISEANGISEIVENSGYYQGDFPDFEAMDEYDVLQWLEQNGTPEMYEMMLSLGDSNLTVDRIARNDRLLLNEKVAAVVALGLDDMFDTDDGQIMLGPCEDKRLIGLGVCGARFSLKIAALALVVGIPGMQPLVALGATAAAGELAVCIAIVNALYDSCVSQQQH